MILSFSPNWNVELKDEGETCGACNTLSGDCGKCKPGLECVKDELAFKLPDLPSRCRATKGKSITQFAF